MPAWGWDTVVSAIRTEEYRRAAAERASDQSAARDYVAVRLTPFRYAGELSRDAARADYPYAGNLDTYVRVPLPERVRPPDYLSEMAPMSRESFGPDPRVNIGTPRVQESAPSTSTVGINTPTVTIRHDPEPPLPPFQPFSPTYDLKRKTALRYQYTPEATKDLYNTPTQVWYTSTWPEASVAGGDHARPVQMMLWGGPENRVWANPSFGDEWNTRVVAHEYGHSKFDDKTLIQRADWMFNGPWDMSPEAYNELQGRDILHMNANEAYAHQSEYPDQMSPAMRERYYPGMWSYFMQPQPQPPPPPTPYELPDLPPFYGGPR